ncbi:MAG: ABC transporter ATP-binding protein [Planctomycetota bacterium]|jgi:ABC-2 type transport system ATP-binding protein|nr:ABC transporter ATP-binding protein [Planctomycetota bacterium]
MLLQVEKLVKDYPGVRAVDQLDLTLEAGEVFAFLGPNGAGKSTTIRILTNLTRPSSGQAWIDGVDVFRRPLAAKRLVGLAAQTINLDNDLTVAENLDFHARLYGVGRAERRRRSAELLDYTGLTERAGSLTRELSGGLRRRLTLARAIFHRPRLLFLDEPTAGLDPEARHRLWALVEKVRHDGVGVFLTTHYIEEAEHLANRVGFINHGRRIAQGSVPELLARLGSWAVAWTGGETKFFPDQEAARVAATAAGGQGFNLRPVNLEDVFLSLTGKKVE